MREQKQREKEEIAALLKDTGPLDAASIVGALPEVVQLIARYCDAPTVARLCQTSRGIRDAVLDKRDTRKRFKAFIAWACFTAWPREHLEYADFMERVPTWARHEIKNSGRGLYNYPPNKADRPHIHRALSAAIAAYINWRYAWQGQRGRVIELLIPRSKSALVPFLVEVPSNTESASRRDLERKMCLRFPLSKDGRVRDDVLKTCAGDKSTLSNLYARHARFVCESVFRVVLGLELHGGDSVCFPRIPCP